MAFSVGGFLDFAKKKKDDYKKQLKQVAKDRPELVPKKPEPKKADMSLSEAFRVGSKFIKPVAEKAKKAEPLIWSVKRGMEATRVVNRREEAEKELRRQEDLSMAASFFTGTSGIENANKFKAKINAIHSNEKYKMTMAGLFGSPYKKALYEKDTRIKDVDTSWNDRTEDNKKDMLSAYGERAKYAEQEEGLYQHDITQRRQVIKDEKERFRKGYVPKKKNDIQVAIDAVKRGTNQVVGNIFSSIESFGEKNSVKFLDKFGANMADEFKLFLASKPEWDAPEDMESWGNDMTFYANLIGEGMPFIGGIMATAFLSKKAAINQTLGTFAFTKTVSGGATFDELSGLGISREEKSGVASLSGTVEGALELIPFMKYIEKAPLGKVASKRLINRIANSIITSGKQSLEEFGQEGIQTLFNNAIMMEYDENRELWDGVLESAMSGAVMGGFADVSIRSIQSEGLKNAINKIDISTKGEVNVGAFFGMPDSGKLSEEDIQNLPKEIQQHVRKIKDSKISNKEKQEAIKDLVTRNTIEGFRQVEEYIIEQSKDRGLNKEDTQKVIQDVIAETSDIKARMEAGSPEAFRNAMELADRMINKRGTKEATEAQQKIEKDIIKKEDIKAQTEQFDNQDLRLFDKARKVAEQNQAGDITLWRQNENVAKAVERYNEATRKDLTDMEAFQEIQALPTLKDVRDAKRIPVEGVAVKREKSQEMKDLGRQIQITNRSTTKALKTFKQDLRLLKKMSKSLLKNFKGDKGKFLNIISNIETQKQFDSAYPKILERVSQLTEMASKKTATQKLEKSLKDTKKIRPEYLNEITAIKNSLSFTKLSTRKKVSLEKTLEAIRTDAEISLPVNVIEELKRLNKTNVSDLTIKDIKSLTDTIDIIKHQSLLKTRLIGQQKFRDRQEAKNKVISEIESYSRTSKKRQAKNIKKRTAIRKIIDGFKGIWTVKSHSFETLSRLLTGDMSTLHNVIYGAFNRAANLKSELTFKYINDGVAEFKRDNNLTGKKLRVLSNLKRKKKNNVEVDGVTMTRAERMSLYALSKRGITRQRLINGGFTTDKESADFHKFENEQHLDESLKDIPKEEKIWVDRWFSGVADELGVMINKTNFDLKGQSIKVEENYFPADIPTTIKNLTRDNLGMGMQNSLENAGFTKEAKSTTAPVYAGDFFGVTTNHIQHSINYISHARAVRDANVFLKDLDIVRAVRKHKGQDFYNELVDYAKDIEGSEIRTQDWYDKTASEIKNRFVTSVLGLFNVTVPFKQVPSLLLASQELGGSRAANQAFIAAGEAKMLSNPRKAARKWKGRIIEMRERLEGGFDREVHEVKSAGLIKNVFYNQTSLASRGMMAIGLFDAQTVLAIAEGVELKMKATQKGVTEQEVNDEVARVIRRTQPMYNMKDRPSIMRTRNIFLRAATPFMSARNKITQLVRNSLESVANNPKSPKVWARATTDIAIATIVTQMWIAAITEVWRYLKSGGDDEIKVSEMLQESWMGIAGNYFFMGDFVSTVRNIVQDKPFGTSMESIYGQVGTTLAEITASIIKSSATYIAGADEKSMDKMKKDLKYTAEQAIGLAGMGVGLNLRSLITNTKAVMEWVNDEDVSSESKLTSSSSTKSKLSSSQKSDKSKLKFN